MTRIQSEDVFNEAISNMQTTVVKFDTTWCPDCKRLNTFIGDVTAKHADKVWYEVDAEEFSDLAQKYDVRGIPTLLVFRNGEKLAHLHSAHAKTKQQVEGFLSGIQA